MKKSAIEYQKYFSILLSKPNYFLKFDIPRIHPVTTVVVKIDIEVLLAITVLVIMSLIGPESRGLRFFHG